MESGRVLGGMFVIICLFCAAAATEVEIEHVLTLDHSNFSQTVSNHDFIVVEFYAPWCGHCKKLAPEYEKAASVLSSHDPPIVLAKIDASEEANREVATEYEIKGFPTLKVFRNGGKIVHDFKGPREADGIIFSLKKLLGPASVEIKSADDVASQFDEKKIFIIGIFPELSGEEFEKFNRVAETLRSDYDFGHTQDAKHLPRGQAVSKPTLCLFKPFELFVDSQDFDVDSIKNFIEASSIPLVTILDQNPENYPYVNKFFESSNAKAMLLLNFSTDRNLFEPTFQDAAKLHKGKGLSFLMGDAESSDNVLFKFFGLSQDQAPLLVIHQNKGKKYLKAQIQPDQILSWLNDYENGNLKPFVKSEPIPEVNDEPVKVVVTASLQDMVLDSGKNVLLEFYAPWCGHCKRLAPILEEVAVSFENDANVMIAKLDATVNDVPADIFEVKGYPTVCFISSEGNLSQYDGDRTKEAIIEFIGENRGKASQQELQVKDTIKSGSERLEAQKDEL